MHLTLREVLPIPTGSTQHSYGRRFTLQAAQHSQSDQSAFNVRTKPAKPIQHAQYTKLPVSALPQFSKTTRTQLPKLIRDLRHPSTLNNALCPNCQCAHLSCYCVSSVSATFSYLSYISSPICIEILPPIPSLSLSFPKNV